MCGEDSTHRERNSLAKGRHYVGSKSVKRIRTHREDHLTVISRIDALSRGRRNNCEHENITFGRPFISDRRHLPDADLPRETERTSLFIIPLRSHGW